MQEHSTSMIMGGTELMLQCIDPMTPNSQDDNTYDVNDHQLSRMTGSLNDESNMIIDFNEEGENNNQQLEIRAIADIL